MPAAARYSLLTAGILVAVAWIAGIAVAPVASAFADVSNPHRLPLAAGILVYLFFGGHVLAFVVLTVAGVSAAVALFRQPEMCTLRSGALTVITVCSWSLLAFFIWRGLLHQY